jgi:hypothetical protein
MKSSAFIFFISVNCSHQLEWMTKRAEMLELNLLTILVLCESMALSSPEHLNGPLSGASTAPFRAM